MELVEVLKSSYSYFKAERMSRAKFKPNLPSLCVPWWGIIGGWGSWIKPLSLHLQRMIKNEYCEIRIKKAGPFLTSRSLNVLKTDPENSESPWSWPIERVSFAYFLTMISWKEKRPEFIEDKGLLHFLSTRKAIGSSFWLCLFLCLYIDSLLHD